MKTRLRVISILALLCLIPAAFLIFRTPGSITVASKQFTENLLLSEMYAQLIEFHTDLQVTRRQYIGTTAVCFAEMESGDTDIYVEYTGTIYNELLGYEYNPEISSDDLYLMIKKEMSDKKGITLFDPIGPNNKYAFAMPRAKAEALGINTMSDLSPAAPKLVFAANDLYYVRGNDGYNAVTQKYNMNFRSAVKMDSSLLPGAAADDLVDVIIVYETDSLLSKYDMAILEDDKQIFPDYYALPIIRNDVLSKHPELNDVMQLLANRIDNERMRELNYLVDIEKQEPAAVARAFLTELGLLQGGWYCAKEDTVFITFSINLRRCTEHRSIFYNTDGNRARLRRRDIASADRGRAPEYLSK